jgi:hypothetical protein
VSGSDGADREDATGGGGPSAFALSRIHAEGWKAARLVTGTPQAVAAEAQRLNPYTSPIERARWHAGFEAALARSRR